MVARLTAFLVCLVFSLAILVQRGYGDSDEFNLEDALKETSSVKQRWDHFSTTTRRPVTTRAPGNPTERWDHVTTTTTRRPGTTRAPSNPMEIDGFDLEDALDDRNDLDGPKKPSAGEAGGLSDKDLEDIMRGGGYKPDKNKGGGGGYGSNDDPGSGISTETGTIAGVASALAMALIGAVSSYISYQQKKFCFSIQQGLNADYVKGENLEAVVCEEPQVTYLKQETQSAEPPPPEPPRI
ncbi:CD99 antigen-like protein 2 isoform X1 [Grammomys surdaster]|uniref:CD99 antigen-like protein 2 isoform X1 n=1 Tax=Grammomys surdaster TaxID=491861 RepID=UPI0010A02F9E|nr:CD99 antigen-like protein 2 isoform X1 [Grammomys surdaster]